MRLAELGGQRLSLLNVATAENGARHDGVRRVSKLLAQWNLAPGGDFDVVSVGVPANDRRASILDFLENHHCDLAVFATRPHRGLERWFERSVAVRALRRAKTMMLMVREGGRGFVDPKTGGVTLSRVLVPVSAGHDPTLALSRLETWLEEIQAAPEIRLLHVGSKTPTWTTGAEGSSVYAMVTREGGVTEAILEEARAWKADLIALPTGRRNGLFAALRGSVSSAILDDGRWPVLSVPAV